GAELFSIAILLDELGRLEGCELLGTDCRSEAIAAAREGFFEAQSLKDVSIERCRYFERYPARWRGTGRLRRATSGGLGKPLTDGPQLGGAAAAVIAVGIFAVVALADVVTPLDVNPAVLQVVALVVAAWTRSQRLLWTLATLMVITAFDGFLFGAPAEYAHAR